MMHEIAMLHSVLHRKNKCIDDV